jgi:hypothetical protein
VFHATDAAKNALEPEDRKLLAKREAAAIASSLKIIASAIDTDRREGRWFPIATLTDITERDSTDWWHGSQTSLGEEDAGNVGYGEGVAGRVFDNTFDEAAGGQLVDNTYGADAARRDSAPTLTNLALTAASATPCPPPATQQEESGLGPLDSTVIADLASDAESSPSSSVPRTLGGTSSSAMARGFVAVCQLGATAVLLVLAAAMAPGAIGL